MASIQRSVLSALTMFAGSAGAQTVFFDAFDGPASILWGNERGDWTTGDGRYFAQSPNNSPLTFTSLTYDFTDLIAHVNIHTVNDGGVWLHADAAGQNGVLLVLARGDIYWHIVVNGNPGPPLQSASGLYSVGSDVQLRVQVSGDNYWAFLPGFGMPVTTLNTAMFPSGRTGLYDFSGGRHDYDDIRVEGSCVGGCCPARVAFAPRSRVICEGSSGSFLAPGAGSSPTYRWQIAPGDDPLNFTDLGPGPYISCGQPAFIASGTNLPALTIDAGNPTCPPSTTWLVRCIIENACGSESS
ncbi:MAG: hypothetical protein IT439_06750, partial [Phycisphaerales bacterium]|nr:hypothetical protein [Phycisphaerales bacterium]